MTIALPARHRRTHSMEFKTDLVAICRQPGISVSAVALAHGVNANLLRRWMKQFPVNSGSAAAPASVRLVPVQVDTINNSPADENIQFDIQRGATRIHIRWPTAGAEACSQWLGEWLK